VHWLQAVQERAEDVQEQAEDISDSSSPAQEQAAAEVREKVNEAAPEEDLGDTLSVLQGAESAMDESESSQVNCLHFCRCCCRQSGNVRLHLEAGGCSRIFAAVLSHITACTIDCICPDRRDAACIVAYTNRQCQHCTNANLWWCKTTRHVAGIKQQSKWCW
jgi:hypothetical protein